MAEILAQCVVCHGQTLTAIEREKAIRVQWDPERGPSLDVLPWRSIQIGIGGEMATKWLLEGWITGIEDVTERALALKKWIESGGKSVEEAVEKGLMPVEKEWIVEGELRKVLMMDAA